MPMWWQETIFVQAWSVAVVVVAIADHPPMMMKGVMIREVHVVVVAATTVVGGGRLFGVSAVGALKALLQPHNPAGLEDVREVSLVLDVERTSSYSCSDKSDRQCRSSMTISNNNKNEGRQRSRAMSQWQFSGFFKSNAKKLRARTWY